MKLYVPIVLVLFIASTSLGQNVKLTMKYGSDNRELNQILDFQNIYYENLSFKDISLNGKFYQLFVKEFKNGKFIKTDTLFDGTEDDYFKIKGDSLNFKFFAQTSNNQLQVQIRTNKFGSKKLSYNTIPANRDYALKNFIGNKANLLVSLDKPFYLFAIITPTIHKDGSGSYCEVAQSDTDPEQFGLKYAIPHYFLVQMKFK